MTARPILSVDGMTIAFGSRRIVDDLSIAIMPGEIVALVGESGSGKTMAARSLLGLLPFGASVTGGTAHYAGRDLFALDKDALRSIRGSGIGMIFQEPLTSLDPSMKVGEQILEALRDRGESDESGRRAMAVEMLARVRVADPQLALESYPHQFSGGMRQRICIAAAMLLRPALLIADEPTTALDVLVQKDVLDLLVELALGAGTGVLLITHDLGLVAEYADRLFVMRNGQLVESGSTERLLAAPADAYTRALLAASPRRRARDPIGIGEPLLEIDSLNVSFPVRGKWLSPKPPRVRPVVATSVRLARGETLAIVGESGSGKTTLARAILGLVDIESGQIRFDGAQVAPVRRGESRVYRKRVGTVFQDPFSALDPRLRVSSTIAEGLRHESRLSRAQRLARVCASLVEVGLDESFSSRFPHQLSGGQRQRVNIARALIADPELVIADEPVSALDVTVQAEILRLLDRLQKARGFACLFVSHSLAVVEQVADRVAVIYRGRIVEEGTRDDIFDRPRHPYTCALLRAAPRIEACGANGFRLARYAVEDRPPPDGLEYSGWGTETAPGADVGLVDLTGIHRVACLATMKAKP
jgi:peptide/nickel transport system ATP-binding protein